MPTATHLSEPGTLPLTLPTEPGLELCGAVSIGRRDGVRESAQLQLASGQPYADYYGHGPGRSIVRRPGRDRCSGGVTWLKDPSALERAQARPLRAVYRGAGRKLSYVLAVSDRGSPACSNSSSVLWCWRQSRNALSTTLSRLFVVS